MRLLHEIAIFQTVKCKVIILLFDTVRLSVSISLRNLYNSLKSIKERYFFLHTSRFTTFDFQRRTCYKVILFPLKSFYSSLKKSTLPATAVRFFTLTSNLHKVTSFFDVTAVKTNVT